MPASSVRKRRGATFTAVRDLSRSNRCCPSRPTSILTREKPLTLLSFLAEVCTHCFELLCPKTFPGPRCSRDRDKRDFFSPQSRQRVQSVLLCYDPDYSQLKHIRQQSAPSSRARPSYSE